MKELTNIDTMGIYDEGIDITGLYGEGVHCPLCGGILEVW